jgi:hypothetical protein
VPAAVYVYVGFWAVDVPPSPNDHAHDVGLPVDVSVNVTGSGAVPDVGVAVNDATGAGLVPVAACRAMRSPMPVVLVVVVAV